jgi:hypothetical protein
MDEVVLRFTGGHSQESSIGDDENVRVLMIKPIFVDMHHGPSLLSQSSNISGVFGDDFLVL